MRLSNKIVFITGATAGIGKACAMAFADEGAKLIITARRTATLNAIADELRARYSAEVYAVKLDVSNKDEVTTVINSLPDEWKNIDILVNNAGLAKGLNKIHEDDPEGWDAMIDTNVKGLLAVTRAIVPGMVEREAGHVINIGSISGHEVYQGGGVYCATKHAVKAISKAMALELVDKKVRVSEIDPGMVETDFSVVRFDGDKDKAKGVYENVDCLDPEDIADAAVYIATRKPHVNIQTMIVMPQVQGSVSVLHKNA